MAEPRNVVHNSDLFAALRGDVVVIDAVSPFVFIGTLGDVDAAFAELTDADVHDLRDSSTNRERYVQETKTLGLRKNRSRVLISTAEIAGISRLSDVLD